MRGLQAIRTALIGGAGVAVMASPAGAKVFDIPRGDLEAALNAYTTQAGVQLIFSDDAVRGHRTNGAKGQYSEMAALTELLKGTGFTAQMMQAQMIGIVPEQAKPKPEELRVAQARRAPSAPATAPTAIETVVVTAQHKSENIQNVPIAVTALSQQQLTERQIAGGPDLLHDVPNMNFGKTNFSGYTIELRGIGTQAISVTTDPAVAVAFNDIPFIRNHFFEQEFYDLSDVEVLRGPQGTLYGRNATAGVVNLKSALPTDTYEAMMSADMGNYSNRRLEGMLNLPLSGNKLDLRIAGEWTKRDGYSLNEETNTPIDGRDLWSSRVTLGFHPTEQLQAYLIWEHFQEDDDRLRSGKQLCKTDYGPGSIDGIPKIAGPGLYNAGNYFTQGCLPASLYSPDSFEAPLGYALPYITGLQLEAGGNYINPYASETQSRNLRVIDSGINPAYRAKNDTLEFNTVYNISPALTFTSQTGYNNDFLFSTEDYNRFGAVPGLFVYSGDGIHPDIHGVLPDPSAANLNLAHPVGIVCDPQLGCSDRLELEDLSTERAWQAGQEFRLASDYKGPFNFSVGANYLHYETVEKYYVFGNVLTRIMGGYLPGVLDSNGVNPLPQGFQFNNPSISPGIADGYIDPNPITSLNDNGHNYFLSQNPYVLNSYAVFGEANYRFTDDLKLTVGARLTDDQKHFLIIPSWLVENGWGYPVTGQVNQRWDAPTGRAVLDWTPNFDFTDQTLVYSSYSHGYKAGGANPPGAIYSSNFQTPGALYSPQPIHPLTFKPEYIDAYELGMKNTLLDGALTLNGDIFFYNYTGYQISEIVDRTAINTNYNATVKGAELESSWEPVPGLKFSFAGGYEGTRIDNGQSAVDLIDRTAGHPGWYVVRPFVNEASNCIFPAYVAKWIVSGTQAIGADSTSQCAMAYDLHIDPITQLPYVPNPTEQLSGTQNRPCCTDSNLNPITNYPGFDPLAGTPGDPYHGQNFDPVTGIDYGPVPNNGAGFSKNLGGHQLPNAPHFTVSLAAEYSMPISDDWVGTFHTDFYWQSQSWARVFNDNPYDKLHGYSNVNLSLILSSANGWQIMGYVKNVFDTTAITGDFLNSDDSGLTTNIFLTDPRLYGVRVTKHLDQGDGFWGSDYSGYDIFTGLFSDTDDGKPPLWIEVGGQAERVLGAPETFLPPFFAKTPSADLAPMLKSEQQPPYSLGFDAKITYTPESSDWILSAAIRYGKSSTHRHEHQQTPLPYVKVYNGTNVFLQTEIAQFGDGQSTLRESHLVMDFMAGKDVGLGLFNEEGSSIISGGVRFAQFMSNSNITLNERLARFGATHYARVTYFSYSPPEVYKFKDVDQFRHTYAASIRTRRNAHGIGPTVSWSASLPVAGDSSNGTLNFDWGLNAAVLFGRQRASESHKTSGHYFSKTGGPHHGTKPIHIATGGYAHTANPETRQRMVTIPNLGAFAGISLNYQNAKVSFGYRADEFFGAMDGGIGTYKSENRGFFGPYANISIGIR